MNYNYSTITYPLNSLNLNETSNKNHLIENFNYKQQLLKEENKFLSILTKTVFEDGQTNNSIEYIRDCLDKNFYITFSWLCGVFQKYPIDNSNRDSLIQYGILRIVSYLIRFNYFNCVDSIIIEMIKAGLYSNINYLQEAALMIIDNLDKDVSYLLDETTFSDSLLKKYSKKIIK